MSLDGELKQMEQLTAQEKWAPPEWALLERLLIDTLNRAAMEFVTRYTKADRTLIWRESWPGMDGSDDPYEGFMNFPLLYALGGSEDVHQVSREIWDAITWQWTQYGQIHDEFDAYYDWMHHGEGYLYFYFFGLADPNVLKDRQRAEKFAGFYTGENPDVPNYDAEKKLIRSPITGSRGPRFQQTEEDWVTHREILDNYLPPFEDIPGVEGKGKTCHWSDDTIYREILQRINERQARGDVPLNLGATSMILHAYLYTADEKYANWVLEYVKAWDERTKRNGGITPDNIGLSGEIGEYNDGKWWGGYYGWRWPHGSFSIVEPEVIAGCNAVLLTGELSYLDLARSQIDMLWGLRKQEDGRFLVPNRHYDDGWQDYRIPHPMFPIYLWNISMQEEDVERAERGWMEEDFTSLDKRLKSYGQKTNGGHMGFNGNTAQWFRYIRGNDLEYPVNMLKMNYELIRSQLEKIRIEEFDPLLMDHYAESMSIHQWQELMPVIVEGLAQLTLGGPMHIYHGGLQHARLRYYDALNKRPGLPESVGALVESLSADSVTVSLVNLSLFEPRKVILQAGTFGEHQFKTAIIIQQDSVDVAATADMKEDTDTHSGSSAANIQINGKWFLVNLPVGTGIKLQIKMQRYVNKPTYETPWKVKEVTRITGRDVGSCESN